MRQKAAFFIYSIFINHFYNITFKRLNWKLFFISFLQSFFLCFGQQTGWLRWFFIEYPVAEQQYVKCGKKHSNNSERYKTFRSAKAGICCQEHYGETEYHSRYALVNQIFTGRRTICAVYFPKQNNSRAGGSRQHTEHCQKLFMTIGREKGFRC